MGPESLIRRKEESKRKIPEAKCKVIAGLYEDVYSNLPYNLGSFNILNFKDELEEVYKIKLSYESIKTDTHRS